MRLFSKTRKLGVEFCERCGSPCDAAFRRTAFVARARQRALMNGMRVL